MLLSKKEEEMLEGKEGISVQKAIKLLIEVGKAFNAPRLIKVASSHMVPVDIQMFLTGEKGIWSRELVKKTLFDASRFKIPTTINPLLLNIDQAESIGIPDDYIKEVQNIIQKGIQRYEILGVIPTYTCCPFYNYPVRSGQHLGGAESVAIIYYNSVVGAMVNRESGPTALATALTGRTPLYGMHLKENRKGQVLVTLAKKLFNTDLSYSDYSALGYCIGEKVLDRIPVFENLPLDITPTKLKCLSCPLGVSAGIAMFHAIGITPEADTLQNAFGNSKQYDKITVSCQDINEIKKRLCTAKERSVDLILLGCPHANLDEIQKIARLVEGKQISSNVRLLVTTNRLIEIQSKKMGYYDIIERSGGLFLTDMCAGVGLFGREGKRMGIRTIATNATKVAHYISAHSKGEIGVWFGSLEKCILAGVTGKWN